jgi:hypothetical protein
MHQMFELFIKEPAFASISDRCSIDNLPEEIWIEIIRHYALEEYLDCQCVSVDLLLPLTLVSNRWGRRIQDTPTLWTDIVLNDRTEDLGLKIFLGLHYSSTAPLSLFFLSAGTWSAVRSMAPSMQSRVSALFFGYMFPNEESEWVMNDLCPLPSLTSVIAPGDQSISGSFIQKHPSITHFHGHGVPITDLCAYLPRLTTVQCSADEDITASVQLLGRMQYLREVVIRHPRITDEVQKVLPNFGSPAWRHLTYGWHTHGIHSLLLNQVKDTLVSLSLEASISSLVNRLSVTLPDLEQLQSLQVILTAEQDNTPLRPPHEQRVCPAREIKIGFPFVVDHSSKNLTIVGRTLRRMVEYAQIMTIYAYGLQYLRALFAETGFPQLESIDIDHDEDKDDDESQLKPLRMPSSLEYLELSGSQALIHLFGSNTVTSFQFRDLGRLMLKASRLMAWSNLRFLKLTRINSSFHHFGSLTLQILSIYSPRTIATVTALCQQLAIYGDRCPRLERLEFSECPEWDVLMIMLERRNCRRDPAVTPIKYIVLPARIPRIIRSVVRERIQGRRSPRPSNYELSLQGNIDIICDSDLCVQFMATLQLTDTLAGRAASSVTWLSGRVRSLSHPRYLRPQI